MTSRYRPVDAIRSGRKCKKEIGADKFNSNTYKKWQKDHKNAPSYYFVNRYFWWDEFEKAVEGKDYELREQPDYLPKIKFCKLCAEHKECTKWHEDCEYWQNRDKSIWGGDKD